MEERRFDDLSRALSRGASRRTVLKGLAAGLFGGLLGLRHGTETLATVAAAETGTCSSQQAQECLDLANAQRQILESNCQGSRPWAGYLCKLSAQAWYLRKYADCQSEQCPDGTLCVDDRCCPNQARGWSRFPFPIQGSSNHCCEDSGVFCPPSPGAGAEKPAVGRCCPAGTACCGSGCCSAEETCCFHIDGKQIVRYCADLKDDAENCGACQHACQGGQVCHDGACVCPEGTQTCAGKFNSVCCKPNERCDSSNLFGVEVCLPVCKPCEIYDPSNAEFPCRPVECGVCEECDGATGECVPKQDGSECGSGLSCCGGRCQAATEQCEGRGGVNTCPDPICQQRNDQDVCVPVADDTQCGSCGRCSGGTCVPDPSRACNTCYECNANGNCVQSEDNKVCGSNEVCCGGTCTPGAACGPCPDAPDGHQCPPDLNGQQICCYGADTACCADDQGNAFCSSTAEVCCTVGTQIQCGPVCCNAATETCGFHGDESTGTCCQKGQVVVSDGSCCDEANFCVTEGGSICCPSGQQCASDPEQTVSICCAGTHADSDGNCCNEPTNYANCADGASICCDSGDEETCCAGHGGI